MDFCRVLRRLGDDLIGRGPCHTPLAAADARQIGDILSHQCDRRLGFDLMVDRDYTRISPECWLYFQVVRVSIPRPTASAALTAVRYGAAASTMGVETVL